MLLRSSNLFTKRFYKLGLYNVLYSFITIHDGFYIVHDELDKQVNNRLSNCVPDL
jgi:hypothetical protein